MNWDDLRLFLAVARTASISGGAKLLGIQHSTVSRRIRKLEENLGVRLLERKKSGYELTAAGKRLEISANRMECEVVSMDAALSGKDTRLAGSLKVSAINNMASGILMPMFAEFSRRYPEVDLHIIVSNNDVSLAQREADVAIRLSNAPTDTLIGKQVLTVASAIYGGRQYLENLDGEKPTWLGVECCNFHKSWTKHSCPDGKHGFFVDDTLLTQAALRANLGISILPCFMGDTDPGLARYSEPSPEWDLGLWILLHPDLKHTARVIAFRDHMTAAIKEQQALFTGLAKAN